MRDINCPYCGAENEINHDDGYGYDENRRHQQECGECFKEFTYTTSVIFYYEAYKADCLNGEDHQLELSHTYPKCLSKWVCKTCEYERELTSKEREEQNIGSIQDYIEELENG